MLNAVRRGSASNATRSIFSFTNNKCSRIIQSRGSQPLAPRATTCVESRPLGTSWRLRQYATARAVLENEAIEAEVEQDVKTQRPPSGTQMLETTSDGPVLRFKELAERNMVCQTVIDTITKTMGLETMTQVQSLTINETLKGVDVLAQARTGTGKTLAFLIPVLQNIISVDPQLEQRSMSARTGSGDDIRAIIISPTRELAEQIAVEARKVTRDTGVRVQTAVGGSQKALGLRKIRDQGCHILVGTPGRLNDVLQDRYSGVQAPNLSALVLDEADRLLDQGFTPEIESIQKSLPDRRNVDRQTLLFSATVPREVMSIVRRTMKPNFKYVRTVQEGEVPTHERVPQKLVDVGGFENLIPALVEICQQELSQRSAEKPFKAIVYFNSTAEVSLAARALQNLRDPGASMFVENALAPARIVEMHGKLTQGHRTNAADAFRNAKSAIMLSSDVTARGMDFPGVTHVIQIGLPLSEDQYVHRIGRTARGNSSGEGWLLLTRYAMREARSKLRGMPLRIDDTLETAKVDMTKDAQLPEPAAKILSQVGHAMSKVPRPLKAHVYVATLGQHSWMDNKQTLVDALNTQAQFGWGMAEPPRVSRHVAQKLGLHHCSGLEYGHEEYSESSREGGGGGGRGTFGNQRMSRGNSGFNKRSTLNRESRGGGYDRSSYESEGPQRTRFGSMRSGGGPDGNSGDRRGRGYGERRSYGGRESSSYER